MDIGAAFEFSDNSYNCCMQYFREAEQLAIKAKDTALLITITRNIGVLYNREDKADSCLLTLKHALWLARQLNLKQETQTMYNYVGGAYLALGEPIKGKTYLDSAENIDKRSAATNIDLIQNQGYVYYQSGQFTKAISYYKRALSLSIQRGEKDTHFLTVMLH